MRALAESLEHPRDKSKTKTKNALAGSSIVELQPGANLRQLQMNLADDQHIEYVARVPVRYLEAAPAAALPRASTLWNLVKIQWKQARALSSFQDANTIKVAVLDTGVDQAHPDLKGRISQYIFLHPDLPLASDEKDIIGHGTHVSGTIAAISNNRIGINGICRCDLSVWKIFDDEPEDFGDSFEYAVEPVMYRRALADCLDQDIDVINLSIGGPGEPDPQELELFSALIENGTTVVAAMGNEREDGSPTSYPAAIPGVIAVGATSLQDTVAIFSNRGNHISLCAPGVGIWSTLPTYPGQFGFWRVIGPNGQPVQGKAIRRDTNYGAWDGTSMATPHVTGAAALLLANNGTMDPASVQGHLEKSADKVSGMGGRNFHPDYGAGRLNLLQLLR
jgi:subtilisin family serine protease